MWDESKLNRLFEMAPVQNYGPSDRRRHLSTTLILRRRHRPRPQRGSRRDAPVAVVKNALAECLNPRDALLVAMLATTGLRRGEALGLRLSDLHFLPTSTSLGRNQTPTTEPSGAVLRLTNHGWHRTRSGRAGALDPGDPAVLAALELVRLDLAACIIAESGGPPSAPSLLQLIE